jgi:HSP20 family molecular chaperone IbpA
MSTRYKILAAMARLQSFTLNELAQASNATPNAVKMVLVGFDSKLLGTQNVPASRSGVRSRKSRKRYVLRTGARARIVEEIREFFATLSAGTPRNTSSAPAPSMPLGLLAAEEVLDALRATSPALAAARNCLLAQARDDLAWARLDLRRCSYPDVRQVTTRIVAADRKIDELTAPSHPSTVEDVPLKAATHDYQLIIRAELSGIEKEDGSVTVEHGRIVIEGHRRGERPTNDGPSEHQVVAYDHFSREFGLPAETDVATASASMQAGILEVKIPFLPDPTSSESPAGPNVPNERHIMKH